MPDILAKKYTVVDPQAQAGEIDDMFDDLYRQLTDSVFVGAVSTAVVTDSDGELASLANVATGSALISQGLTTAPIWGDIDLTTTVIGVLPVANGGTNASSWTAGSVIFAGASGTSLAQDNAGLFWNDSTNALGLGTALPLRPLHVHHSSQPIIHLTTDASGQTIGDGLDLFIFSGDGALFYRESAKLSLATNSTYMLTLHPSNAISVFSTIDPGVGVFKVTGEIQVTTPLDELQGGTGTASWTQGDIPYSSAANTIAKLAKDANATRSLTNTGASNAPAWAQVALATGVSGDLPFANLVPASAVSLLAGRGSAAGAGDFQEITLGTGLTMTGTELSAASTSGLTQAQGLARMSLRA